MKRRKKEKMAEENGAVEVEYFLSVIIEPIASMLVTILGWAHDKAVSTTKTIVYTLLASALVVTAWKTYKFVKRGIGSDK